MARTEPIEVPIMRDEWYVWTPDMKTPKKKASKVRVTVPRATRTRWIKALADFTEMCDEVYDTAVKQGVIEP